jgi:spermidine synthase
MTSPSGRASRLPLIAALYGLSGGLGLVYEVAFNKYLAYVFGATAYASSAVLVAFMGGLSRGAAAASRFEPRIRRPLLAYGITELVIGGFCMVAPLTFSSLTAFYVNMVAKSPASLTTLSALRALIAVAVVLVPAAGMGATLPLLARFVQRGDSAAAKRNLARFYALNTFGGALGSLLSAYVIVPTLGLTWTMRASASLSLTIGAIAVVLGWGAVIARAESAADGTTKETPRGEAAIALIPFRDAVVLSAASGLLVFACEVVFVHLLALVIGTSVYAFGLMLFIFLVCLSLGTPIATRLSARFGSGAAAIGFAVSGVALVASLSIWDRLPPLFIALGPSVRSWGARELTRGLAALLALCVPVIAMGTTFPLVLRASRSASVGSDVGKLTVANTLGSIVGSIAAGFLLLPHLGSQRSLVTVAVVYLAVALFAARRLTSSEASGSRSWTPRLVAVGVALAVILPRWDLSRLTSGANVS